MSRSRQVRLHRPTVRTSSLLGIGTTRNFRSLAGALGLKHLPVKTLYAVPWMPLSAAEIRSSLGRGSWFPPSAVA